MERFDPDVASTGRNVNVSRKDYLLQSTALDLVCLDKMFADKMLCDVTLVAEQVEIPAHKLILAASSTYFYWKFTNDRKLGLIRRIEIRDMKYETLSSIINYMYKTEILITEKNVWNLMSAAYMFALRDLQKACQDFVQTNLSVSNCLTTEITARKTHLGELESLAGSYIDAHFTDIIENDAYLRLTYENFSRVISRDTLCAREEDILVCIFNWIRFDLETRKYHVYDLMKYIRFPLIPLKHILQRFEEENWLKSDPHYNLFAMDIFKVHILNVPAVLSEYRQSKLLVVVGVTRGNQLSLEIYDYCNEIWLDWPESLDIECGPQPRVTIHGSTVYCLDNGELRSIDITNPNRLKWSEPTVLLNYREKSTLVVFNNNIYAVGGKSNNQQLESAEMLDTISLKWKMIAKLSEAKRSIGLCLFNDSLFAIGGRLSENGESNSVEYYKSDTNSWYTLPNMPIRKCASGVAAMGSKLYVVGGCAKRAYKSAEVYNHDDGSWSQLPDMAVPRYGPGVIAIEDRLYVIGGSNDYSELNSVEVFHPASNAWSMLPNAMRTPKEFVAVGLIEKSKLILNS